MVVYLLIFLSSLICILYASEIVLLTGKALDRSYKFFLFASIVVAISSLIRLLNSFFFSIDEELIKYLDLVFIFLFLDGLIYMKRLIKVIEEEKISKIKNKKTRIIF